MMHISKLQLENYMNDKMSEKEQMAFLEHIAECDYCAGQFASAMEKQGIVSPPPDFRRKVLEQTVFRTDAVRVVGKLSPAAIIERRRKKQKEMFFYTAKVVLAMGIAIVMVVTSGSNIRRNVQQSVIVQQEQLQDDYADEKPQKKYTKVSDSLKKATTSALESITKLTSWFN